MEEEIKTASYYINKYNLKKTKDEFTGDFNYQREFDNESKNTIITLIVDELDETTCRLMKATFFKKRYDSKYHCMGTFGEPKYIENIKNDIKEYEENLTHEKTI